MNELYQELETNREQGLKLLSLLEDAKLISMLKTPVKADIGTVRETFFNNQLSVNNKVSLPAKGDFKVDDRYLFEIGGRKKSFEQIKDEPDSFLAVDSVETGNGNRIPLWLFGFLS